MPRYLLPIMISVVAAGLVWVWTVGSLFGVLLIVGAVAALGLIVLPRAIDRIAEFLSTGGRRPPR